MQLLSVLVFFVFLASCDSRSDVAIANEKGILIVGNSNEPKGLDPHLVSGVLESNIFGALFEGLCTNDPEKDSVARPGAAESWKANEDFTQWIFHLNPKAKWSDGEPVTSEDFAFSYKRLLSPDPAWPAKYAEILYFLKNAEAYHQNEIGHILCGLDPEFPTPWKTLKKANFGGDEKIKLDGFDRKKWSQRTDAQKRATMQSAGLDKLDQEQLKYLRENPSAFDWPEKLAVGTRELVLRRLLDHRKAGSPSLWDKAQVGVHAVDKFTLRIDLRGPVPYLPEVTKHFTWYPVPKHTILEFGDINTAFSSEWTQAGNLVSNGPFKLKTWETNHLIEVERNPYYWDNDNVSLNGIRFLPISNYYTETRMFGDDQLHVTYTVPPELIPFAKENYPAQLRQEPYVGVRFLRTNTLRAPFDNPKVRRAFAFAIDQEAICKKILRGGQQPASGIVPPFGAYDPPGDIHFDPERARRLLEESGYQSASGFPDISLLTTDSDSGRREAEALQAMWQKHLGINVRIVQREWTNYLQKQYDADYDLSVAGWIGDYLDPTTFLEIWTDGNGNNNTGWSSEKYENLLQKSENTADPKKRLATLAEAEKIMLEDTPALPIYWYTTNYLIRPEVKNWNPLLLNKHPFKYIKLDTGK